MTKTFKNIEWGPRIPTPNGRPKWFKYADPGTWRYSFIHDECAKGEIEITAHCSSDVRHTIALSPFSEYPDFWWSAIQAIFLPADHWAYKAIEKGYEPWGGGAEAPEDWAGAGVLFANGSENNLKENWDWQHTLYKGKPAGYSIIGYRKKPVLTPASDDAFDVSKFALVQKMTEAEFQNRFSGGSLTPLEVGRELGIIRKETLLEQFELEHPNIVVGPVSRVVAQAAIEWMENKK